MNPYVRWVGGQMGGLEVLCEDVFGGGGTSGSAGSPATLSPTRFPPPRRPCRRSWDSLYGPAAVVLLG